MSHERFPLGPSIPNLHLIPERAPPSMQRYYSSNGMYALEFITLLSLLPCHTRDNSRSFPSSRCQVIWVATAHSLWEVEEAVAMHWQCQSERWHDNRSFYCADPHHIL